MHQPYGAGWRALSSDGNSVGWIDKRVHDESLVEEIELTGELIIAASRHEGPLSQAEVDELLGLA